MVEWLNAMTSIQRVAAYIALAGTFALAIQFALLLIGMGGDAGIDTDDDVDVDVTHVHGPDCDHDGLDDLDTGDLDGLRPFTLRGLTAFVAIFGWSSLILLKLRIPSILALTVGTCAGVGAMILIAMAFRAMYNLQTSGNIDIRNACGLEGTVYITVPAARSELGKVNVLLQERYCELDAVTNWPEAIPTGTRVVVTNVEGNTVVIEPYGE